MTRNFTRRRGRERDRDDQELYAEIPRNLPQNRVCISHHPLRGQAGSGAWLALDGGIVRAQEAIAGCLTDLAQTAICSRWTEVAVARRWSAQCTKTDGRNALVGKGAVTSPLQKRLEDSRNLRWNSQYRRRYVRVP